MHLSSPDWVMQVTDILAPHKTLLALLFIFSLTGTGLSSCSDISQEETQKLNEALNDSLLSSTETWGVDMKLIEDGLKIVRVKGSYAATINTEDINETRISGPVHIDVYDSTGTIETRVDCNRAVYLAEESEFELFGNVRVRTSNERYLRSEYLKWEQANNTISTPKFVIIITPTDSIAGSGFNGTTDLSTYTIKEPTGRHNPD